MSINGVQELTATVYRIEVSNQDLVDDISFQLNDVSGDVGAIDQSDSIPSLTIGFAKLHPDASIDWGPLSNIFVPIDEPIWRALESSRRMALAQKFVNDPGRVAIELNEPNVVCQTSI